jgi:cytochrome c oxidase subunit 2
MQSFLAQYMPENASAHGPHLDTINALVHWMMLFLFVGWTIYFIYVLYRFRARRNPRASYAGAQSHASTWVEGAVVVAEIVLLVGFSIPAWSRWISPPPRSANPLEIRVLAEQFAWNVHYPGADGRFGRTTVDLVDASNPLGLDRQDPAAKDDIFSLNQLHLPVNRPVTVRLSAKDVIHSFSLPSMRVKQDAIPGMEIPVHFTPVKTSAGKRWEIACAQLCGLGHYRMRGFLTVETEEEFETWLTTTAAEAAAMEAF